MQQNFQKVLQHALKADATYIQIYANVLGQYEIHFLKDNHEPLRGVMQLSNCITLEIMCYIKRQSHLSMHSYYENRSAFVWRIGHQIIVLDVVRIPSAFAEQLHLHILYAKQGIGRQLLTQYHRKKQMRAW